MADPITPRGLARELGTTQLAVRNYLRSRYGKLPPHETRWLLTEVQAEDVRAHFGGQG